MPPGIELADTVTELGPRHRGRVLVAGSHGGIVAARYALRARVRAVVLNDAGVGLDDAGIAGLAWLEARGLAACTVSHRSARIARAADALANGIVSHVNRVAAACGVAPGQSCREAAARLLSCAAPNGTATRGGGADARVETRSDASDDAGAPVEGRTLLQADPEVWGLDSIGQVVAADAGRILVIGSHCELHGGRPESALPVPARAAFFHDAGLGGDADACTRLPVLAERGIPAAAVDARTARIGDARSLWATGRLAAVNAPAAAAGWHWGMSLPDAVARVPAATPRSAADPDRKVPPPSVA